MKIILLSVLLLFQISVFAAAENEDVIILPRRTMGIEPPITTSEHVGGVLMNWFIGFGSGQAFQGTWKERGQKFTYGELASTGVILLSLNGCRDNGEIRCRGTAQSTLTLGVVSLLGLRLWSLYDAVVYPLQHNRRIEEKRMKEETDSFYIDPVNSQVGVVVSF
jgi:hypothetical protein